MNAPGTRPWNSTYATYAPPLPVLTCLVTLNSSNACSKSPRVVIQTKGLACDQGIDIYPSTRFKRFLTYVFEQPAISAISRSFGGTMTVSHPRVTFPDALRLRRRRGIMAVRAILTTLSASPVSAFRFPPTSASMRTPAPAIAITVSTSSVPRSFSLGSFHALFSAPCLQSAHSRCVRTLPIRPVTGSYWQTAHSTCVRLGSLAYATKHLSEQNRNVLLSLQRMHSTRRKTFSRRHTGSGTTIHDLAYRHYAVTALDSRWVTDGQSGQATRRRHLHKYP